MKFIFLGLFKEYPPFKFVLALTLHKGIVPRFWHYCFHSNCYYDPQGNNFEQGPKGRNKHIKQV